MEKGYQNEFPIAPDVCYLNHAAVSPWPIRTAEAVKAFADENVLSGASNYLAWLEVESKVRKQIKDLLNASSADDISLLKNTSEALSVVACGIDWQQNNNIVTSDQEFPSNRIVWEAQALNHSDKNVTVHQVDLMSAESPEIALINACDENTRVLAISSVQYGTGLKLDLVKLGEYCREQDIYFCVDAIQSIGAHELDIQAINADFVMADAHKWMCGPEGIALFYCRAELREELKLHQYGWHMIEDHGDYTKKSWSPAKNARRFECGSPNMLGIHALSASLSLFNEIGMKNIEQAVLRNTSYLIDKLDNFDNIGLLTPRSESRRAGIVTFKLANMDMTELYTKLMNNKVICANRLGGVRLSPHFYTSTEIIDKSLEILAISYA